MSTKKTAKKTKNVLIIMDEGKTGLVGREFRHFMGNLYRIEHHNDFGWKLTQR